MPLFQFLWTDDTIDHIARHQVTPEEFEEVAFHPDRVIRNHRRKNRVKAFGWTSAGRRLAVIYEILADRFTCYPVTAFDVDD